MKNSGGVAIRFVLFDMIGTTINESYKGGSLILHCFQGAFRLNDIEITKDDIRKERGKSKKEAITNLIGPSHLNDNTAQRIYDDFLSLLVDYLPYFSAMADAEMVFNTLKREGMQLGLGSGLPFDFMFQLIDHVGWDKGRFDYIASSEDLGKGRPDPIMIKEAMSTLNIQDPSAVLKLGDTVVDIREGKNAGAWTAAILSGTTSRRDLENEHPDYIIQHLPGLFQILEITDSS